MKERIYLFVTFLFLIIALSSVVVANDRWQSGFDSSGTSPSTPNTIDSVLTLDQILDLVAKRNPHLRSIGY